MHLAGSTISLFHMHMQYVQHSRQNNYNNDWQTGVTFAMHTYGFSIFKCWHNDEMNAQMHAI